MYTFASEPPLFITHSESFAEALPNIPLDEPNGIPTMGFRILTKAIECNQKGISNAFVLVTTKIDVSISDELDSCIVQASHLTLLNENSHVLYYLAMATGNGHDVPRRLCPNASIDTIVEQSVTQEQFQQGLMSVWGRSVNLVCWNAQITCESIAQSFPAIQVFYFAQSRLLHHVITVHIIKT